nr:helix-turn-helix domain-containing protein [Candidatus Sigynarchaeota archaeon]
MSIKPEVREALKKLGFSEYNIIIYETLLKEKEMDARVLSQKTRVPYSRVYEILNEMIEKGQIIKHDGRPSTYIPRSPIDVLQSIQHVQESEFQTNSMIVKEPLMGIYSENRSAQNAQLTITYGKSMNVVHLKNAIKNSVRSLQLILNDFDLFFDEMLDELKLLKLKHVSSQFVLAESVQKDPRVQSIIDLGEFKFVKHPPLNLIIVDEQNTIMVAAGDYVKNVSEDIIGVSFSHSSTAFILRSMFKNIWNGIE